MKSEQEKLVWDWWPLTRFLTVLSFFGLAAYFWLGWRMEPRHLLSVPFNVFEIMSFFAMISFALAHLYLLVLVLPFYAIVELNDVFYNLSHWTLRKVFRVQSNSILACLGLLGEIALFGTVFFLLRYLLSRF